MCPSLASLPDIDSPDRVAQFVDAFYAELLADDTLRPIFIDVAAIDLSAHKPLICAYWCKLLFGENDYARHTMNIHRLVHSKRALTAADFELWLGYFVSTIDTHFVGVYAERAKRIATAIASNMQRSFNTSSSL